MSDFEKRDRNNELRPLQIEGPKRRRTFRENVVHHFKNYCSSTSIHGFTYFGEDRTLLEYIWWFVIFSLGISGAAYMIYEIYMKWVESPVIVSFATKRQFISHIPFPALTICPATKIQKKFFNLTAYIEKEGNVSEEMRKIASYVDILCGGEFSEMEADYIDEEDFFSVILENRIKLRGFLTIGGKNLLLNEATRLTMSGGGPCFTFNRFNLDEIYSDIVVRHSDSTPDFGPSTWDPITGRNAGGNMSSAYPKRVIKSGANGGIKIFFVEDASNNDFNCNPLIVGYTIYLHYPSQIPTEVDPFFVLPANDVLLVSLDASLVTTSATVKKYSPEKRDCYFQNEKQLKYFKYYTSRNCDLECLTNATLSVCGCVRYYMPRENGTRICGSNNENCMDLVEQMMASDETEDEDYAMLESFVSSEFRDACDCLPSCTDITYTPIVNPIKTTEEQMRALTDKFTVDDGKTYQFSGLVIYFQDDRIETTERNELYGPTDFISNFGGLLGLFTGFSILSMMEIIYFLSIRLIGNIQLYGHWAGPSD